MAHFQQYLGSENHYALGKINKKALKLLSSKGGHYKKHPHLPEKTTQLVWLQSSSSIWAWSTWSTFGQYSWCFRTLIGLCWCWLFSLAPLQFYCFAVTMLPSPMFLWHSIDVINSPCKSRCRRKIREYPSQDIEYKSQNIEYTSPEEEYPSHFRCDFICHESSFNGIHYL